MADANHASKQPHHAAPIDAPPALAVQLLLGRKPQDPVPMSDPPITFGRTADNRVVLTHPNVSRHHGEMAVQQGQWVLINCSPHGTKVNKTQVTDQPVVLSDGDVVCVGSVKLFRVQLRSGGAARAGAADHEPDRTEAGQASDGPGGSASRSIGADVDAEQARQVKKKKVIYTAIGVYLLLMLAAFVWLGSMGDTPEESVPAPEAMSRQAISQAIAQLPQVHQADARLSQEHLAEANRQYELIGLEPDALYRAHHHYQLALAYSGEDRLTGQADRRLLELQERLSEQMWSKYRQAFQMLKGGQYERAAKAFAALMRFYPDLQSSLHRHMQAQWAAANQAQQRHEREMRRR